MNLSGIKTLLRRRNHLPVLHRLFDELIAAGSSFEVLGLVCTLTWTSTSPTASESERLSYRVTLRLYEVRSEMTITFLLLYK